MATRRKRGEAADPIFAAEMEAIATERRERREVGFQAAIAARMQRWPKERKPAVHASGGLHQHDDKCLGEPHMVGVASTRNGQKSWIQVNVRTCSRTGGLIEV